MHAHTDKVKELEELNQSLRLRDKVKDDAIAQLSDQLVSLSARLQEIERSCWRALRLSCEET